MQSQHYIALAMLVILAVVGVYDIAASGSQGRLDSVSSAVREWSARWPILPLAVGVLIGHLFW